MPPSRREQPPSYFATFPPDELLPAPIAKLAREYRSIVAKFATADAALRELDDDGERMLDAIGQDADARARAAREGKSPNSVGSPAVDAAVAERATVLTERNALADAIRLVGDELCERFSEVLTPEGAGLTGAKLDAALKSRREVTGAARLDDALAAYAAAVDAMQEARKAVQLAAALPRFWSRANSGPNAAVDYRPDAAPRLVVPPLGGHPLSDRDRTLSLGILAGILTADATDADAWITEAVR